MADFGDNSKTLSGIVIFSLPGNCGSHSKALAPVLFKRSYIRGLTFPSPKDAVRRTKGYLLLLPWVQSREGPEVVK